MTRWLPDDPMLCLEEAIQHLDFAPTTQEDQQQVEDAVASVKARVAELESTNGFLRSTLHRCIAHAGLPDPATGCRAIIATAKEALQIP